MRFGAFRRWRWLLPWAALVLAAPASAQPSSACVAIVRIGLTPGRLSELGVDPAPCQAFATGNEYQLLDWLENGALDAAILSPFAARLAMRSSGNPTLELFQATRSLPFKGGEMPAYRVGLEIAEEGAPSTEPARKFDDLILAAAGDKQDAVIDARSHLDQGFIALLAYTEQRVDALGPEKQPALWRNLLGTLRFVDAPAQDNPASIAVRVRTLTADEDAGPGWLDLTGTEALSDVLVYNTRLTSLLWEAPPPNASLVASRGTVGRWLDGLRPDPAAPDVLLEFVHDNYRAAHAGSRQHRHFRFTVPELFTILRNADAARPGDDPFGLVLTGGGVKAAYQTHIVEDLYERGLLVNETPADGGVGAIAVDHIIGTSGGALLGIFVSAIDGGRIPDLTASLWSNRDGDRYIESYDVFPFLEMPRYLSAVLSLAIFGMVSALFYAAVAFVAARWDRITKSRLLANVFASTTLPNELNVKEGPVNAVRPGTVWVALLLVTPWMIKFVTGDDVLEHVPAIAGIFYMLYAVIAIYSDNRVIYLKAFKWRSVPLNAIEALGLVLAVVAIFLPLVLKMNSFQWDPIDLALGEINGGALATCFGFSVLFLLLHRAVARPGPDVQIVPARLILSSLLLLVLAVAIPQFLLFATGKPTYELSVDFWLYLLVFSALTAGLFLVAGHLPGVAPKANFVRETLDFLHAAFPRRTYMLPLRRHGRIALFFAMSFVYWNFVMAPALYGNEQAERYLANTYKKFVCAEGTTSPLCDTPVVSQATLSQGRSWTPKTLFVMSATSLEQQEERYFLFHPEILGPARCATDVSITDVDEGSLRELAALDRRWRIPGCTLTDAELLEAAFSSGSPFPVFPAKRVAIHKGSRLVDGGYAHNMPIEASVKLGARRTLVVSSSPLHQHATDADSGGIWTSGFLFHNLGRLFPYLFSRSQVEDALSAQDSLVVTISPLDRGARWPLLTDFHGATIEYLVEAANTDLTTRIGAIESWGTPLCTIGGSTFSCRDKTGTSL